MDCVFVLGLSLVLRVCLPHYIELAGTREVRPAPRASAGGGTAGGTARVWTVPRPKFGSRCKVRTFGHGKHVEKAHGSLRCPPVLTKVAE